MSAQELRAAIRFIFSICTLSLYLSVHQNTLNASAVAHGTTQPELCDHLLIVTPMYFQRLGKFESETDWPFTASTLLDALIKLGAVSNIGDEIQSDEGKGKERMHDHAMASMDLDVQEVTTVCGIKDRFNALHRITLMFSYAGQFLCVFKP